MRKITLAILNLFFSITTFAQADNRITIGTIDTIQSNILAEKRKLLVYVPNKGPAPGFSQQKYPVVYLLDGDGNFNSVVGMIQYLSQVNGNTACPEMIIVGISNTNRNRDLTPTKTGDDPSLKNLPPSIKTASGGGEAFLSFIEKELMPYIDATYPTQPYKILIGHSFGGLTAMNALINHTKLFNTYIAVDPSMWWDNLNFLKDAKKTLAEKDFTATTLYVGIANTMDPGTDIKRARKDTTADTRQIRSILDMDDYLKARNAKGLKYASKFYENDTHGTVSLNAVYDALRFIFADYQFKAADKDMTDSTVALADKFRLRYEKISKLYGYDVAPAEMEINRMGYLFLRMKQFKKAESFFKMNVENYPGSFNVHDSYGDFFVATGDTAKATEQFKKALAIQENGDTRMKLNKLLE